MNTEPIVYLTPDKIAPRWVLMAKRFLSWVRGSLSIKRREVKVKPYRDPIVVYGVGLLVIAALSFYGGFRRGVDRKSYTYTQTYRAIGFACIDYVTGLKPRKVVVKPDVPKWIANNCGNIAERSMERINGVTLRQLKAGGFPDRRVP